MRTTRQNEIETLTETILKDSNQFLKAPVDIIKIAKENNIIVVESEFEDTSISGMISKKANQAMIVVNKKDNSKRKRFTIAHELGHYFLHLEVGEEHVDEVIMFRGAKKKVASEDKTMEREANAFAAAILMNKETLVNELRELVVGAGMNSISEIIEYIAVKFQVSEEAMKYRLNEIGLLNKNE